jgi:hypothetical protein
VSLPPDLDFPNDFCGDATFISEVLAVTDGRIEGRAGAADLLGHKPSTLRTRMMALGIVRPGGAD